MKRLLLLLALALVIARPAAAQAIVAPSAVIYTSSDADLALTGSVKVTFYACASVTAAGACVNPSATAAPNPPTVPKLQITSSGTTRRVSFTPLQQYLQSLPVGAYVVKLSAIGDPNAGGTGASAESAASDPFFPVGRTPGVPTVVTIQP